MEALNDMLEDMQDRRFYLEEALVVGPYLTERFFRELRDQIRRKGNAAGLSRLTILADDGWDQSHLDQISRLFKIKSYKATEFNVYRVCPEKPIGLVHAKIYFFHLRNLEKTYSKRILVIGSANASSQGFGTHAETFISFDLADLKREDRKKVEDYMNALSYGRAVEYMYFYFCQKSWASLPAMNIVSKSKEINSFDNWLKRGRLCHEYQSDSLFGKLSLRLKKPLPKGPIEKSLNASGFGSDQDLQLFVRNYVAKLKLANTSGTAKTAWRKRYFVETYYGHWTSGDCYEQMKMDFVSARAAVRRDVIQKILESKDEVRNTWLDDFENAIRKVTDSLRKLKTEGNNLVLEDYLRLKNGEVDVGYYRDVAEKKLLQDQYRAYDKGFTERYISGFYFPPVPQIGDQFEEFALDFCQSLQSKFRGINAVNLIARAVKKSLDELPNHGTAVLLKTLRKNWEFIKPVITKYYE
jgi:hypothetical protein